MQRVQRDVDVVCPNGVGMQSEWQYCSATEYLGTEVGGIAAEALHGVQEVSERDVTIACAWCGVAAAWQQEVVHSTDAFVLVPQADSDTGAQDSCDDRSFRWTADGTWQKE